MPFWGQTLLQLHANFCNPFPADADDLLEVTMEQPTCGQGLAENSWLPGKLGELAAAMAETLDVHMRLLDANDPQTKQEYEVYYQLANEQRETAARLLTTANEMAGARELPMGRHDFSDRSRTSMLEAFEKYVRIEQELLALLEQTSQQDQVMLAQMRDGHEA